MSAQTDKAADNQVAETARSFAPRQVRDITIRFQVGTRTVTALDNLSFSIRPGIVTGLIGADGAGKTTLMRLASGLRVPESGTISVLGHDATHESLTIQSMIGYMPQRFGLYEDLSVRENLDLYSDLQGVAVAARPERYDRLMEMTGMAPFMDRLAGRLSGGMKQKLGLACTLIRPPQLLLLDEPTVGVDPVSRRELWSIVYHQVEEEGMTVLLSTAYLDEAERCGEVILLNEGKMLGQAPPTTFSDKLAGHAFEVRPASGNRRALQERLSTEPGVVDALILGEHVRVVTEQQAEAARLEKNFSRPDDPVTVQAVAPRFEDAFIYLLRGEKKENAETGAALVLPAEISLDDLEEIIVVHDLERKIGDFYAVRNLSFSVRKGEIFGLLGANGAGKSTTLMTICGVQRAARGEILLKEEPIHHLRPEQVAARGVAQTPEGRQIFAKMSTLENLEMGAFLRRDKTQIAEDMDWVFTLFPVLKDRMQQPGGTLSGGEQQMLAIGRALMSRPELLLLDEPSLGLAPKLVEKIFETILEINKSGVTIFLVEQNAHMALTISSTGYVMETGRIVLTDKSVNLLENEQVKKAYLGE